MARKRSVLTDEVDHPTVKMTRRRYGKDDVVSASKPEPAKRRELKKELNTKLRADVVDRLKNTAAALIAAPTSLRMANIIEQALERELKRLEKEHNQGKRFPPRSGHLPTGRSIGR